MNEEKSKLIHRRTRSPPIESQPSPDEVEQRQSIKIRGVQSRIVVAFITIGLLFSSIGIFVSFANRQKQLKTIALTAPFFKGSFHNQLKRFTALVIIAQDMDISQILLPSIRWGDGIADRAVLHDELFDVEHWNTFYPRLPRLVTYDPKQHYQWDATDRLLNMTFPGGFHGAPDQFLETNIKHRTMPYGVGGGHEMDELWIRYRQYRRYSTGIHNLPVKRKEFEELMSSALVPSRVLRKKMKSFVRGSNINGTETKSYLTLHARIEPDMEYHPQRDKCEEFKDFNLTEMLSNVEETFANTSTLTENEPPFQAVFLAIDRQNLIEGAPSDLARLTEVEMKGMWNGRSRVFSVGAESLIGQIIDFFIAIESKTFVGTPLSTWSTDVWTVRY
eukprot:CAMPEP_0172486766 /NCGR_PEP_ID=MMETSP1066-20121228/15495_1 /TAXON_ID=671091 /ORGANISM="Coscinodiscus wailesii, Strain CCMP2513" /LENGTH=388 /DNA_ID=CAMNT_0013252933 /DNA_START=56 /DNA_END=1219 /DNA_ORIENTATION=+